MRDSDVRKATLKMLTDRHAGESYTRIVQEMGVWSGSVRIDIAVINGELSGFELKSERDTLGRLQDQAELYSQVFDRLTLVAADRHYDKAVSKIPDWWGIMTARFEGDVVTLQPVKEAMRNEHIEPIQVARLLWRAEALSILERLGLSRGYKSRPAEVIAARLAEVLSPADLATEVRAILKSRSDWLGKPVSNERKMSIGGVSRPLASAPRSYTASGNLSDSIISPTAD